MAILNESLFRLSIEDISPILKSHNLGDLKYIKSISKGIESQTFSLITENSSYILTLFETDDHNLTQMQNISHFFTSRGFPVPKIVATCEVSNKKSIISSHLTGKVKSDWTIDDYEAIGFLLGNIHKSASAIPKMISNTPFIWQLSTSFYQIQKQIPKEFQRLEQEIILLEESWPLNLPKGFIHGDLWHKNVLFEGANITGLLDFKPSYEPYILDLANLIKKIPQTNTNFREALLSGYELSRPLSLEENQSLDLLVYSKILATILYLLNKSLYYPNRKDEFQTYAYLGLLKLDSIASFS